MFSVLTTYESPVNSNPLPKGASPPQAESLTDGVYEHIYLEGSLTICSFRKIWECVLSLGPVSYRLLASVVRLLVFPPMRVSLKSVTKGLVITQTIMLLF